MAQRSTWHRIRGSRSSPQAYAYASGRPLVHTDPTGRLVAGVYLTSAQQLTLVDVDTGASVTADYSSGGQPTGDPVPAGTWDILEQEARAGEFYRLEHHDDVYGDDIHQPTGRDLFRLHRPGRSIGCITAKTADDWSAVYGLIEATRKGTKTVRSKARFRAEDCDDETLYHYGEIDVLP